MMSHIKENAKLAMAVLVLLQAEASLFQYDKKDDSWAKWKSEGDTRAECPSFTKQPNIIFILFDDLGWNDIGYHNLDMLTPNLDRLAEEGMKLEQNYMQSYCGPSRSALMTGMYPYHIGRQGFLNFMPNSLGGLTLSRKIMPQFLQELNYTTHIIGKWHLGVCSQEYLPTRRGFDTQYGIYNSGAYNYAHVSYTRPFPYDFFENDTANIELGVVGNEFQMDLYHRRAIQMIEQYANSSVDRPMFMYLSVTSPHFPVEAPPEYIELYPDVDDSQKRKSFMAMVSHLDNAIGDLVNVLNQTGLYDNSVIIVTSDNGAYTRRYVSSNLPFFGGGSNDLLRGQKVQLYEGGVRVPAFIHSPLLDQNLIGSTSNKMVHVTDWVPTLVSLAGGDVSDFPELSDTDGVSQYESLFCGKPATRESIVYNLRKILVNDTLVDVGAIRYGRWKIINIDGVDPILPIGTFEMYDLQEDPNETKDLFTEEPDIAQLMVAKFQEAASSMVPEDNPDTLGDENLRMVLDNDGAQATNFCNLDGTRKEESHSDNGSVKINLSWMVIATGYMLISGILQRNP